MSVLPRASLVSVHDSAGASKCCGNGIGKVSPAALKNPSESRRRDAYGGLTDYRALTREGRRLHNGVLSNGHSPEQFRVNGVVRSVVRNLDPWYAAFNVQSGDRLYLSP
jgi:hypothetical protein